MTRQTFRFAAALLILAGSINAWAHSQSVGLLHLPSCLGQDVIVRLDTPSLLQLHCWGCYTVLVGAAMLLWSSIEYKRATVS